MADSEFGMCLECRTTWKKQDDVPPCTQDELGRDMSWCSESCYDKWVEKNPGYAAGWVAVEEMDIDELKEALEEVGLTIERPN